MQAKDIPELPVLNFLAGLGHGATWFPGFENSVQNAMPEGTPEKVALAKMRALIKKGFVEGCPCGCRGNFELTEKGRLSYERDTSALRSGSPTTEECCS